MALVKQLAQPPKGADNCYLFYWLSNNAPRGTYGFGSREAYSRRLQEKLLRRAMNALHQWVVMVISCHLDTAAGSYYEEIEEMICKPVRLGHNDSELYKNRDDRISTEELDDEVQAMIDRARHAGNPRHYLDTVVVLRLATPKFLTLADDDGWHKAQAVHREKQFRQRLAEEIERLAAATAY